MQTCINVLAQIYTSAYFVMGLLMKALEITWAKSMYMQYIFPCGCGMHLLIAGIASIGYLHGETGLGELSCEFVCSLWLLYFLIILIYFWCLCCWQCKKIVWKRMLQNFTNFVMRLLSCFASSSLCCGLVCSVRFR